MITVNKKDFLNCIKAIKSSCGKNSITPILGTIHIKTVGQGLQLTATDTVVSARTIIEANVGEPLEICINAEKLENIINALGDIITIECPEQVAIIKSGKTKFEVLILDAKDYPLPSFELSKDKITLSKDDFIKGVNCAIISTAPEEQNILSGICLTLNNDSYEMAATDGNRLSQIKFDEVINREGQYIIPHNIMANISRVIKTDVEIYFENNNRAVFKTGNFMFATALIAGTYPQYTKLLPQSQPINILIRKEDLYHALERVAIMSDNRTNITVFEFKDGELHLTTACDGGKAEDTISIQNTENLKLAFNFRYILEGIKAMQIEYIEFGLSSTTGSCLISGDFKYLVMPIVLRG